MTGTGTQADPYVVDNWNDFKQAAIVGGNYVKFADGGGTIDMADGQAIDVFINANVDGNGWTIKNMSTINRWTFWIYGQIKNFNFVDFQIICNSSSTRKTRFMILEPESIVEQCRFSGVISGKYSNSIFAAMFENTEASANREAISRCSFNLKITGGISMNQGNNIVCSNCIFDVDSSENQTIYPFYGMNFRNCLIKGKYWGLTFLTGFSKNVVLDVECPSTNVISCTDVEEIFIGNSDKANYDTNKIYAVTTDQLKDADYLLSLGLPIGNGEITAVTVSNFVQGGFNYQGAEMDTNKSVRSDFIPVGSTAFTVESGMLVPDIRYKNPSGKFVKLSQRCKSGCTFLPRTKVMNISEIRIALENEDYTAISPPQSCVLYNGFTWKIDSEQNDGLPFPVLAPKPQFDYVSNGAFKDVVELSEIYIPESVKKIGTYSFSGTSLTSVKIAPDCAYSDTSFPSGCVVEFYGNGDYEQLYDADGFALLDSEGARIYSRSENNG